VWLEYIQTFSTPFIALCGLCASVIALWVSSRTASKADLARLEVKVSEAGASTIGHGSRIKHLEDAFQSAPTRHELQTDISRLAARMSGVEAGQLGISKQLDTTNTYLHTLVESRVQ
jgi:hypothetical protein